MDGAMPKTVLISLAAVVALIVIVILLGMRYLRADDEDDFDDDVPAEPGRSRSRGTHYSHSAAQDQPRPRRQRGDMPDERFTRRPRSMPQGTGRGAGGRTADRAADRVADDRGWRDDGGRGPLPPRDARPARAAGSRRDHDDVGEPAAASARRRYGASDRAGQRGADDFDARPGRPSAAARDYERDRGDGRDDRDRWEGRDGRDRRDARTVAISREAAGSDRDERDRRSASRSAPRQDGSRKNGPAGDRDELLPAIKPRQGRNKHDADGEWPSNEWDELSDVDYWAEVAADKPLNASLPAEQPGRPGRSGSRTDATVPAARSDREPARPGRQPRQREAALQPEELLAPVTARKIDQPPAGGNEDLIGTGSHRAALGRTEQLHAVPPGPGFGRDGVPTTHGTPADDDPLTSPSFPRIAADDSRSYRRARRAADESQPSGPAPASQGPAGRRHDGSTQPPSYPHPIPAAQSASNGADYVMPPADPYALPASSTVPSYPIPAAASASGYHGSTASYSLPASSRSAGAGPGTPLPASLAPAGSGGYVIPGGSAPGSYLGTGSYAAPADADPSGYQFSGGAPSASYLPPAAAGPGGYGGETVVRGNYLPPAQDPASFRSPGADSGGYQTPPGGYSGAGLADHAPAAAPASYAYQADSGEYRVDRADLPGGYAQPVAQHAAYADPGSVSGPHPLPDPGYPGGYGGNESGFHASLAAQTDAGHPAYPAPVPVGHGSPYPPPGGQLPGRSPGYQDPYQQAPYDQPGYQPAPPQAGYAGADPYAVDPYGYSGHGGGR
jgi:hypothetical protein